VQQQLGERSERCERNNSADMKARKEGGGGGIPGARAEIFPLQPLVKTMVRQAVPLQPMEDLMPEQVDAQWRLSPHGEPVLEQAPGRTCDPTGDPHWSSLFLKDCTLWEASTLGSL